VQQFHHRLPAGDFGLAIEPWFVHQLEGELVVREIVQEAGHVLDEPAIGTQRW